METEVAAQARRQAELLRRLGLPAAAAEIEQWFPVEAAGAEPRADDAPALGVAS